MLLYMQYFSVYFTNPLLYVYIQEDAYNNRVYLHKLLFINPPLNINKTFFFNILTWNQIVLMIRERMKIGSSQNRLKRVLSTGCTCIQMVLSSPLARKCPIIALRPGSSTYSKKSRLRPKTSPLRMLHCMMRYSTLFSFSLQQKVIQYNIRSIHKLEISIAVEKKSKINI